MTEAEFSLVLGRGGTREGDEEGEMGREEGEACLVDSPLVEAQQVNSGTKLRSPGEAARTKTGSSRTYSLA